MPWRGWLALGWPALAFAIAAVLLRRVLVAPVAQVTRPVWSRGDALFVGWFGPIGIAAVFYATLAARQTGSITYWRVGSLVVAASILAYAVTSTGLTKRYDRATGTSTDGAAG